MAIEKTPNGRYRVRWKFPNGQWRSKTVSSLDMAKKVQAKFETEGVELGVFGVHKAPAIDAVWKKYIKWAEKNKRSWKSDESRWNTHLAGRVGSRKMDRINPRDVQKIVDDLSETPSVSTRNKGQLLTPSTVKQCLQLLNRVYSWATRQKLYYGLNPCAGVELPAFDDRLTECLPSDKIKTLLDVLDSDPNERAALIVKFALYTGRRRGEILSLRWDDVDLGAGRVTFYGQMTKNGWTQVVPVNKSALEVLQRAEDLKISELVFPCSSGRPYKSFGRTWNRIREKAGVEMRFHGLRHTFASHLASSGKVDLYTLGQLLGHRELAMTQRYSHLSNGALLRAANVADHVFGGGSTEPAN